MYTLTTGTSTPEYLLADLVLRLVASMKLPEFDVICREVSYDEWPIDKMYLPRDADQLNRALNFLADDVGFFTLSCQNRALIIPFEGGTFNIVVADGEKLPEIEGLHVKDSTDVLTQYEDAYEGFGVRQAFPPDRF